MSRAQQLALFTKDLFGLDRLLRFIQAVILVVVSYPGHYLVLHQLLSSGPLPAKTLPILSDLAKHLDLGRRWMRILCFLDCFSQAHVSGAQTSNFKGSRKLAAYFDVAAAWFNGLYLLTEVLTFPDALGIDGLTVWDKNFGRTLDEQAMRFWFLATLSTVVAEAINLRNNSQSVPSHEQVRATGEKNTKNTTTAKNRRKQNDQQRGRRRERNRQIRTILAGLLDMIIPADFLGWIRVSAGIVNMAMVGSTVFSGIDVWKRCGREVAAAAKKHDA